MSQTHPMNVREREVTSDLEAMDISEKGAPLRARSSHRTGVCLCSLWVLAAPQIRQD